MSFYGTATTLPGPTEVAAFRDRLERYAVAIASGWYSVTAPPMQGLQDFGEHPRADEPRLVASAIVEHALALMADVDDTAESFAKGEPLTHPPAATPGVAPSLADALSAGRQTADVVIREGAS